MTAPLPDDLVELIESGVSTLIGTRDAQLRPECVRAAGTLVHADRTSLTVMLAEAMASRTLENLDDNAQIAITYSRPMDHRTLQIKGYVYARGPATPEQHAHQERYLAALVEHLYWVGLPRAIVRRLRVSPAIALSVRTESVFIQTPGPGAGRKLEAS